MDIHLELAGISTYAIYLTIDGVQLKMAAKPNSWTLVSGNSKAWLEYSYPFQKDLNVDEGHLSSEQ